jgi:hypothetical protein
MWDRADREEDARRLARGEGLLAGGHETPGSTVLDAGADAVREMPAHSAWPPLSPSR